MRLLLNPVVAVLLLAAAVMAAPRRWATTTGQTFEAEFVRVDGENGIFRVKGREDPYPLIRLSAADRLFINQQLMAPGGAVAPIPSATPATPPSPIASAAPSGRGSGQLAGQALTEGGSTVIDLTIADAAQLRTVKEAYGKESTKAKMLVALPAGFQPGARNYPLLIVNSTTDGKASSIGSAKANYLPDVTAKGYVLIAVDGEFGKPEGKGDSTEFRWALNSAGLDAIYKEWAKAKAWPLVNAGVSGGGGYASHQAMIMLDKQYPLMGLLLAVTAWTPGDFPDVLRRAPRAALRTLPVFFTAGESDQIATKEKTEKAQSELTRAGFKNVRYEKFPGGHELHRPHLQAALDWFLEQQRKSAPNLLPAP